MPLWEVEVTDEFTAWYEGLSAEEQESVTYSVGLLMEKGPTLPHPHSSGLTGLGTGVCANCECSMRVDPTVCSTHSIRAGRRSY